MARSRWLDALLVAAIAGVLAVGGFAFRHDLRRWLGLPDGGSDRVETVTPGSV
jgi:hypothetical protein